MSNVEDVTLEIDFGESFVVPRLREHSETLFLVERSGVRFELNRQQKQLGSVTINQWWIPLKGLYADRKRESPNYQEILDCFWGWCQHVGSATGDRNVQESFILASLLPEARSNGSRRVFLDAFVNTPTDNAIRAHHAQLPILDSMLRSTVHETIESAAFTRMTGEILGPPEFDAAVRERYDQMARELFEDACAALTQGDANGMRIALDDWRRKIRTISRRAGRELEKQVLDVLSYECRAAFHRAYSATWLVLMRAIEQRYGMSQEELIFHRLWHLDQMTISSEMPDVSSHLFHGHIFGLHPAFGDFLLTRTGAEMVGDFLSAPSERNYQRILHGLQIAVYHYDQRHEVESINRTANERNVEDIEVTHADVQSRRSGRRRNRPPPEN